MAQPIHVDEDRLPWKVGIDGVACIAAEFVMPVARPLMSPRLAVVKRPFNFDIPEGPLAKCPKLDSPLVQPSQGCASVTAPAIFIPRSPTSPNRHRSSRGDPMTPEKLIKRPVAAALDEAVEVAIGLYKEVWTHHALESECGPARYEDARDDRADRIGEQWAAENYEVMCGAVAALLPWVGGLKSVPGDADYDTLRFQGVKPPRHLAWRPPYTDDEEYEIVIKQLKEFRSSSTQNRARDALITLCAALSCRAEKCWVEAYDNDLRKEIEKLGLRRTKSQKMKNLTNEYVADLVEKKAWCCQFARALVMPSSFIWMSFARGVSNPLPASLIVAHRMTLADVFAKMGDENPLVGEASSKEWWTHAGRQLTLQDAVLEEENDSKKGRQPASSLKPDPRLRDLLRCKKPVLYLDMLAALAPREISKTHGLSDILKAELAMLFREAKARGEAVIFALGSSNPRKLAQRVYLRPPLNDFGLRCGFFRWRESADAPWAREKELADRTLMMLQMP